MYKKEHMGTRQGFWTWVSQLTVYKVWQLQSWNQQWHTPRCSVFELKRGEGVVLYFRVIDWKGICNMFKDRRFKNTLFNEHMSIRGAFIWVSKIILKSFDGFTILCDWLRKLVPPAPPICCKIKTNRDLVVLRVSTISSHWIVTLCTLIIVVINQLLSFTTLTLKTVLINAEVCGLTDDDLLLAA